MKLSRLLVGGLILSSMALGCSKPKAFQLAEEWHTVGDVEKEKICKNNAETPSALIGGLQGWIKTALPQIEGKSKEFATAIGEIKEKGDFEKLVKMIEKFNPDDEPCDKAKAKLNQDEGKAYFEIGGQIKTAIEPALKAYEAKAKELGVTVNPDKFRP